MATTYEAIQTYTTNGSQSSIDFTSIPSTYTDLILISTLDGGTRMQLNGDTGTSYSQIRLYGNGTSTYSDTQFGIDPFFFADIGGGQLNIYHFMNYSNTSTYKTALSRGNIASGYVGAWVGLFRSTSALSRVYIYRTSGTFTSGTTATLYGIKSA